MLKPNRRSMTSSNRSHLASNLVLAAESVTSDNQSQRQKTYLRTLPNPTSPISYPAAEKIYLHHRGEPERSMHHGKPTGNAHDVATTIYPSNARTTPSRTFKIDSTPGMAKEKTETTKVAIHKSSANGPSTLSKQKTSIPLPISSMVGEVWRDGAGNGEVGRTGTNGDSGWSSTSPDLTKIKSRSGAPEGKNVKSIPPRHWSTGFSTHSSWSTTTRLKWRDVTRTGSYRLRRNHHPYGTVASQGTRDITWDGTHHHPRPEQRSDATCEGQPEDADHSLVIGLSRTGWWIRRAIHANARVRPSTWITMVPKKKSWHLLGSLSIDFPAITECEWSGGNDIDDYGSGIEGLGSPKEKCQRTASAARSGYTDTRSNHIRRSSSEQCSRRSSCLTVWGMHSADGSDFVRHRPGFIR